MALLPALLCVGALGAAASPTPHELAARELELRARELDLRERELELRERELEALQQQPRPPKPLKTFGTGLAGFLANGEIFGEFRAPAKPEAAAGDVAGGEAAAAAAADDLSGMSVKDIKRELSEASVGHADYVEKSDLLARLRELRDAKAAAAARAAEESEESELEEQDFMHGFTAVFGVSVAAQGAEDWGEVAG